jgi:hypothetical protein
MNDGARETFIAFDEARRFRQGGPVRALTYRSILGPAARPLAEVLANWRVGARSLRLRRRLLRLVWPGLASALDDLAAGVENWVGPL